MKSKNRNKIVHTQKNIAIFIIGKRNCHQRSELAGWVTCTDTDPTTGLSDNQTKQVHFWDFNLFLSLDS